MAPLVGEELGECKRSHLAVRTAEPDDRHAGCDGTGGLGRGDYEVSHEADDIAADEKPASAEEIGVGTAGEGVSLSIQL